MYLSLPSIKYKVLFHFIITINILEDNITKNEKRLYKALTHVCDCEDTEACLGLSGDIDDVIDQSKENYLIDAIREVRN